MKILTVVGARPQFIKSSVMSSALARTPGIVERVVHTGQHFDASMSQVFFDELGMRPPDISLNIHGGSHGEMTGRMLIELEGVITNERPDAVLVFGDTNSTLAAALAAAKLHVPVAHVEAGLRSGNRRMPEEVNRVLTDHVATWLFAPTDAAVEHLVREGLAPSAIIKVGDVMFDAALAHGQRAEARGSELERTINPRVRPYALVTIHRAENTNHLSRLRNIVDALCSLHSELRVVWTIHPRTRLILEAEGWLAEVSASLTLLEPQGYLDMVWLERHASVIVTDSGGVQKEAFFHRIPCVTVRDETEWVELVSLGWNRLAPPTSAATVRQAVLDAIGRAGSEASPYGDGRAAERIAEKLASEFR